MSGSTPRSRFDAGELKLPKTLEADPRCSALKDALRRSARKLWREGDLAVPVAAWSAELATILRNTARDGQLVRGLESIETTLSGEARGLSLSDARSGAERGSRVSRLLLLSNDGSERFYRQVERLVLSQQKRVLPIRLEADSGRFAEVLNETSGVVRALLIAHKARVAEILLASYP